MSLDTKWQIEQTWGSNQAVLRGVIEGIRPHTAVECGCGSFSTPILRNGVGHLTTIEHDKKWARIVQKDFPPSDSHKYEVMELAGVNNGTSPDDVSHQVRQMIEEFYNGVAIDHSTYDFVMVDTFRCARVIAASILAHRTSLIMLHDVRPSSREFYHYHKLDHMLSDWYRYEHRPEGMINKAHIIPWTALYSRYPLNLDAVQAPIIQESERLWNQSVGLELICG